MARVLHILSVVWAIYFLMLNIGVPVYQVHCNCTDSKQTSVLLAPESCADKHFGETVCDSCCHSCEGLESIGCCQLIHPDNPCDDTQINYLLFEVPQEPLVVISQFKAEPVEIDLIASVLVNTMMWLVRDESFSQSLNRPVNHVPLGIYNTSSEYLSFICQRKLPLSA
jgi:hypothetical protein